MGEIRNYSDEKKLCLHMHEFAVKNNFFSVYWKVPIFNFIILLSVSSNHLVVVKLSSDTLYS